MHDLSATEVARNLSEVLDAVEHRRESFRITRGGRVIARVTPEEPATGKLVKELLAGARPDAAWREDLLRLRASLEPEAAPWRE
jgi:antitoxin (DNA-binding transcriptional repressor) of toxin-antitoxin stability system